MKLIANLSKDLFITEWKKDQSNSEVDINASDRIQSHETQQYYYYEIELAETDLIILLLPHHVHTGITPIPSSGMNMLEYGEMYSNTIFNHPKKDDPCLNRTRRAVEWFDNSKGTALFMYVSDNPDLAVKGHYANMGREYLYAGSSHKFAAYSAWVKRNGFKALKLFYVSDQALATN